MTTENREDAPEISHEEICNYIAEKTGFDYGQIEIILEHSVEYTNNHEVDEDGEVRIDTEEQVAYIKRQRDVTLSEDQIETILDLELEFLVEKGIATQVED